MVRIIIGIVFIIGGLSGKLVLRGTNSGIALAIFGVILIILGIVQMTKNSDNAEGEFVPKERTYFVKGDKLVVYNKSHESYGELAQLKEGDKILVEYGSDFGRFLKVTLDSGLSGYVLKQSLV
jgi:hypothetical protein